MVNDFIVRKAVIEAIISEPTDAHYPIWYAEKIAKIKPADVAPVVRAIWLEYNPSDKLDPRMICSHCHEVDTPLVRWKYCPSCGAKIQKELTYAESV